MHFKVMIGPGIVIAAGDRQRLEKVRRDACERPAHAGVRELIGDGEVATSAGGAAYVSVRGCGFVLLVCLRIRFRFLPRLWRFGLPFVRCPGDDHAQRHGEQQQRG